MKQAVDLLLSQSIAGGIVIAAVLLIRAVLLRRASARWVYALWLVAAIRLLLPLQWPVWPSTQIGPALSPETIAIALAESPFPLSAANSLAANENFALSSPRVEERDSSALQSEVPAESLPVRAPSWKEVAFCLWLAGALATAAYIARENVRYYMQLARSAVRMSAPGCIPVYRSCADSPCLSGFFRPRIYVNEATLAEGALHHVLLHETAHARRGDNFWLLLKNLLCVLYWFHPLVWVAAFASARDCECACDECATKALSPQERIDYAQTIVRLSGRASKYVSFASAMRTDFRATKTRVARLVRPSPCSRRAAILAAAFLLATCLASFATGEAQRKSVIALPETFETILDYDIAGDGIVLLADGCLYSESAGQWTLMGEFPLATRVATGTAGTFVCENGESADVLMRVGTGGALIERYTLPKALRIDHMEVLKDQVIFTATDASAPAPGALDPRKAYSLNLSEGTLAELSAGAVYDLCADASGALFLLHEDFSGDWAISQVDVSAAGNAREIWRGPMQSVSEIAAGKDGLYLLKTDGTIWWWRAADVPEERVPSVPGETEYYHMLRCDGGALYACASDFEASTHRLVSLLPTVLESEQPVRTLTIVNAEVGTARSDYMESWMREQYPDVELQYLNMDTAQLATRLMAGDAQVDLIYEHASLMDAYAQSGAFLPLNALPAVSESMESSGFLSYASALAVDGNVYCVPELAFTYAYALNEPLLQALNLQWPQPPYTWETLADWAIDALAGTGYQLFSDVVNPPYILYLDMQARSGADINLDSPAFRQSMEAYRRLWQAGLIGEGSDESRALAVETTLDARIAAFGESIRFAPVANLDGTALYPVEIHGYYVYTRTQNADLVEAYLAEYCSARCQNEGEYGLSYQMLLADAEGYSREWANTRPEYAQETDAFRLAAAQSPLLRTKAGVDIRLALGIETDLRAYLNGELSFDEYIVRVQPQIDMVQYE